MKKHIIWALSLAILTANVAPVWADEIDEVTTNQQTTTTDVETEDVVDSVVSDENIPSLEENPTEGEVLPEIPSLENAIILSLGSNVALLKGEPHPLDVAPATKEGNTYVELRFVVEQLLEAQTVWDPITKQTTITKDSKSVTLTPNSKMAIVNGASISMPGPVVVENNRTLVPLRFLSEEFGVKVDFNQAEKSITLTATNEIPVTNTIPVAQFEFLYPSLTAGQSVEVTETSYDEDGDQIVAKMWMVDGDPNQTSTSLHNIFKKPKVGIHQISLKVKDAKGVWSEWTTQAIEVLPNQKPVVDKIKIDKESYAQGEEIKFDYEYTNESWERITDARWSYRSASDKENKKIGTMPKALFSPGEFIITLQLTDEYGNVSELAQKSITITDKVLMTEFEYKFTKGEVGEIVDNFDKNNYRDYKEEENVIKLQNGETLIMSNSPERVMDTGILYEEEMLSKGRIMIHHINAFGAAENAASKKNVIVTVENTNEEPVTLTITNKVVKVPSTDQLYLGQQLLIDYFRGKPAEQYTIQPGEIISIYDSKGSRWSTEEGISGLMDYDTTAPLTMRVAAINEGTDVKEVLTMGYPARDVHPRGTYPLTEKYYKVTLDSRKPTSLILCKDATEWAEGIDAITGETVTNRGNYGITYRISVTAKEDTGIILNPRGGLFRGAIKWEDGEVYLMPKVGFLPEYERSAVVGVVKAGETRTFQYMLPNGSAAPVLIGFVPESAWSGK
ncbi:MAG: stalk domain-containing protein [Cellulosilyticaceae bacterium]